MKELTQEQYEEIQALLNEFKVLLFYLNENRKSKLRDKKLNN